MPKFPIPDDLIDLIEKLIVIEEEEKKRKAKDRDGLEPLYDYEYEPRKKEESKPTKIEISLE